jgi:ankyrin repeat protein
MFVTRKSLARRAVLAALAMLAVPTGGIALAAPSAEVADAAMRGDHDQVLDLLEHGADANAAQGDGMTALHWAVTNQDVDTARSLIYAGANVHATTRLNGVTPLWLAAQSGEAVMVYMLLDNKADADAATGAGVTPLMIASASGNPDVVQVLIERGANPNSTEKTYGQTPLMFAAANNEADIIAVLVAKGADAAVATKARTSSTSEPMGGLTALHYAVRQGNVDAVDALLDRGADINQVSADNTTPLMLATVNGQFDLAMHLLERGADATIATAAGGTPLYRVLDLQWAPRSLYPQPAAVRQQKTSYLALMTALLERGADPNARLRKALWYTRYGLDAEGIDLAGATPFWRAAEAGDADAMRLLVAHGADPTIRTVEGVSPLMVLAGAGYRDDETAVPAGRMPALRYLVEELHADVNETDAKAGESKKTDQTNIRGYTPIHNAAARGDNEMIRYLVSKGGRVDLVGKNGVTSVDMASAPRERAQPFPETIKLLESLGAKSSRRCVACKG